MREGDRRMNRIVVKFAMYYNRDSSILYNSLNPQNISLRPSHRRRCIFEKSLMCENRARALARVGICVSVCVCWQAGYYQCREGAARMGRCLGGVNFNNCASALSFKLRRRHVIPAPSRKQPQHFTHKKSMAEPLSSFLHTHANTSFPPSQPTLSLNAAASSRQITQLRRLQFLPFTYFIVFNVK